MKALAPLCLLAAFVATAAEPADLEKTLASLGYKVQARSSAEPSGWEKATFDLRAKRQLKIRRRTPLPEAADTYPRFVVIEETYADEQHATARLARLREPPPGLQGEEEKIFPLRDGLAHENRVLIVTTDAVLFEPELSRLVKQLREALAPPP
jgi:hypothetical protein